MKTWYEKHIHTFLKTWNLLKVSVTTSEYSSLFLCCKWLPLEPNAHSLIILEIKADYCIFSDLQMR